MLLVVRHTILCALMVPLICTAWSPARAQDTGDVQKGRDFAARNCAECHAIAPTAELSPRPNVATFRTIANTPGMTAQALSIWLTTSHPTMPNLIIEPTDRRNVIAYIESLRERR